MQESILLGVGKTRTDEVGELVGDKDALQDEVDID